MATTLPSNAECTLLEGDDIISVDPENYAEKNNVRGNSDKGSKSSQLHEAASLESYSPHNDPGATVTLSDRDAVIEKRLVGKTDAVLLPFMGIIVLLQYLDKAILSYAALLGMTKQLQLVGNEYSWAASIYFFGFIAGLPLWCLALQRFTTDRVIAVAVLVWGIVCSCHAVAKNYSSLLGVRFFLGFFEAAITPAYIIIVGAFYTKKEVPLRTAIWYSFNGLALVFGGCMSWSLLKHRSLKADVLPVWKELYIILGSITIFFGFLVFFFMPSTPALTKLYSEEERRIALTRSSTRAESNVKTLFRSDMIKSHIREAWTDVRLYIVFVGLTAGSIPIGGVTAYSLQLLSGFGFPVAESLMLTLAPGGAQIVAVALFVVFAMLSRSRAAGAVVVLVVAIAGSVVMHTQNVDKVSKTVGYTLLNMGAPAITAIYSLTSSAVAGHGKKVMFATVGQVAYAVGNIIGPLTFLDQEAPVYHTAKAVIIACLCTAMLALWSIVAVHFYWNRRRGHHGLTDRCQRSPQEANELSDEFKVTDFENPRYRYVY